MKTKVTQKEWNDARDAFLCAIIQGAIINEGKYLRSHAIEAANELTSELYEVADHNVDTNEKVEDTRPFNPKVVEIFEKYLPKEIAPLAIEAHKRSCEYDGRQKMDATSLENALHNTIQWAVSASLGKFGKLHNHIEGNTITATPEQLREWFPMAYQNEGGENE